MYSLALFFNKRRKYRLFYFFSHIEISFHAFLAILCLGWQSNFGFFFIGISLLIFFIELFKRWIRLTEVIVIILLGILSYFISVQIQPVYKINSIVLNVLGSFNMVSFILLCLYIINDRNSLLTGKLKEMAEIDGLTGVYNRHVFNENLEIESRRMLNQIRFNTTSQTNFAIAMLDIDDFKVINDLYGHLAGDNVLREVVHIMEETIFSRDILCRFGGDEFAILFISTPREGALTAIEKIRRKIEEYPFYFSSEKAVFHITVSIGFASFEEENDKFKLLHIADKRLYDSKARGKNRIVTSDNKKT